MKNIEMKTEYQGYIIEWSDYDHGFTIFKNTIEVKENMKTLDECQKWIHLKNKQKFKRVPILYNFNYQEKKVEAEASSIVDDEYVWVTSGTNRAKASINDVWLDTSHNRIAIEVIKNKENLISKLKTEIREIEKSTDRLTAKLMIEEVKN